jgi:hypothetical protein
MLIRRMLQLLAVTLIALTATPVCNAAPVELIRNGASVAKIYVSGPLQNAEPVVKKKRKRKRKSPITDADRRRLGAEELNYHLEKMSGAALEVIVTDKVSDVKAPGIVLGKLAVELGAKPQKITETQEGFRILTKDKLVLIGGQSDMATLNGVYELLNRLGCDWVMPGEIGEIIPASTTVRVPDTDVSQAPDFETRRLWYRGWRFDRQPAQYERMAVWLRRQRGASGNNPVQRVGGHAWGGFIKKHKKEFAEDPTMLALVRGPDGKMVRKGPQIETTHPRVIELFIQDIKAKMKGRPKDAIMGYPIGPADGMGYSTSAESTAAGAGRIDAIMGAPDVTDELILLANRILKEVHKEYPNVYVGYYSYSVHGDYPIRYKPDPKIVMIFAPISFSRFHSVLDENSKTQGYYRNIVEQWSDLSREQGNPLIYRGYNWNLADNMLPFFKARIWGLEVPYYKSLGFLGFNVEATKAWSVNGPSDYVFMKLLWDSSQDWKTLLSQYCRKAFGAAAAGPMEQYFHSIIDTQHGAG